MNKKWPIAISLISVLLLSAGVFIAINLINTQTNLNNKKEQIAGLQKNNQEKKDIVVLKSDVATNVLAQKPKVEESVVEKFTPKDKVSIPVLMYHHISNLDWIPPSDAIVIGLRVSPDIFERHLQQIQSRKFSTITSEDLYNYRQGLKQLPEKPIMITVDDGYEDNYTKAFPLLKKYNMKADFAIITGFIGQNDYMTWDQVKDLKKQGMDISSHTVHHCYLAVKDKNTATGFASSLVSNKENMQCPEFNFGGKLDTAQIKGELEASKKELEKQIGQPVYSIVYPFGNYNEQVEKIAADLGYKFGFTVKPQNMSKDVDFNSAFSIPRTRVNGQQKGNLFGFFQI